MANPLYLLRLSIGRVILWFTDIVPDGWMSGASMTPRTDRRVELLKLVVRRVCQNRLEALSNPILPKTAAASTAPSPTTVAQKAALPCTRARKKPTRKTPSMGP